LICFQLKREVFPNLSIVWRVEIRLTDRDERFQKGSIQSEQFFFNDTAENVTNQNM